MTTTPPATGQTPAGSTTLNNNMEFELARLAYLSASDLAGQIATAVKETDLKKPVVVAGVDFLSDLANLTAVGALFDTLLRDYNSLEQHAENLSGKAPEPVDLASSTASPRAMSAPSSLLPVADIATGLNTAIGIASLFRQEVSFSGVSTEVDATAFEIALAAALKDEGFSRVLIPDLFVIAGQVAPPGGLQSRLQEIEASKLRVWRAITPAVSRLVELDTSLDQAVRAGQQTEIDRLTTEIGALRRDLSPISEPLSRVDQRFSDILGELRKVSPDTGLTGLARLLRSEAIGSIKPVFLHAKIVSGGGHTRTVSSLLRSLFTGDAVTSMGGVIVRWALLDEKGEVQKGGILTCRHLA